MRTVIVDQLRERHALGQADIWAITSQPNGEGGNGDGNGDGNAIYRWNNTGAWVDVQGAGKRVAMDANSNAWAITEDGEIWRHEVR